MAKRKDWFKPKKYPHIGLPLILKDRHPAESYIKNTHKIATHAFLPLIRRIHKNHRYKVINGVKRRQVKERFISYASHFDAQIYGYYGQILENRYLQYLKENGLEESIIAYRSIPRENGKGGKCNIDFAKDTFDYIRTACNRCEQAIIIADITSFFDNLDHRLLKFAWKEISGYSSIPEDEYNVYKHVTRFAYVMADDLFNAYKSHIICKQKKSIKEKRISNIRFLRDKDSIAFCDKKEISKIRSLGLIHPNSVNKGIPQGLPISSVLANIYMWNFDRKLNEYMTSIGGYYRRYSDDIVLVFSLACLDEVKLVLQTLIKSVKLDISEDKTSIFVVSKLNADKYIVTRDGKVSQIEYLGLAYDGNSIRLKNKSISKYFHKMLRTINAKTRYAIRKTDKTSGVLFVNQLLKKFTPIGSRKHSIYLRSNLDKSKFFNSGKKSFGNYWSYVIKAGKICQSSEIPHQLSRNKIILRNRIVKAKKSIEKAKQFLRLFEFFKYGKVYH